MPRIGAIRSLLAALWVGSGAFLIAVAAPAAFRFAGDRTAAANIVGAMLTRWHYIAIAVPVILLILELRRGARTLPVLLLSLALLFAAGQAGADLRIRSIRLGSPVPISDLSSTDPVRRQFGMLLGVSSMLMLLQTLLGGGWILASERSVSRGARLTVEDT